MDEEGPEEDEDVRQEGEVKQDEADEDEDHGTPTKKSAILRGGVSRRALDLLLMKIGYKGFYPLGVFLLLFYANAIGEC